MAQTLPQWDEGAQGPGAVSGICCLAGWWPTHIHFPAGTNPQDIKGLWRIDPISFQVHIEAKKGKHLLHLLLESTFFLLDQTRFFKAGFPSPCCCQPRSPLLLRFNLKAPGSVPPPQLPSHTERGGLVRVWRPLGSAAVFSGWSAEARRGGTRV